MIIQRVPWTVQPQFAVGIDRTNPLGKAITALIPLGGIPVDVPSNAFVTYGSGGVTVPFALKEAMHRLANETLYEACAALSDGQPAPRSR